MSIISGDTFAERAVVGTLGTRYDSTPSWQAGGQVLGDQPVFVSTSEPTNLPQNAIWFEVDSGGNIVKVWVNT